MAGGAVSLDLDLEREALGRRKILVVVVDLDDDVGSAGVETPLRGYDEVLEAAVRFALHRPEDSDVNTIFAGLSVYSKLRAEGYDAEIALVSGHPTDLLLGQQRVSSQVEALVRELGGDVGILLVSDSDYDMMIAEVLRSYAPLVGVKRVVVEQHLGIEASYMLLARYIKKALTDPRFSKYTVGLPGALLATGGLLSIFGLGGLVLKAVALLAGLAMAFYGFNLEPVLRRELSWIATRPGLVLAGYVIMTIFALASSATAYYSLSESANLIEGMAGVMRYSVLLFSAGAIGYIIVGRILYSIVRGDFEVYGEIAAIVLFIFAAIAFYRLGATLQGVSTSSNLAGVLADALLESNFLSLAIVGASLAGLIELIGRTLTRRGEED
jgi:putative membrane protein